ncbi:MAG: hypothetical protein IMW97_03390 [Firmicutes bacterium]|nr:hypothetical protein [Candidatus Fermentithermobacillaceae bacterium]
MDWDKLQRIDVRWIYVLVIVCLLVPMFWPLGLPITISENTRKVWEAVDKLPPGSVILVSHDTGPGNAPELNPMLSALAKQAFEKNCKIVGVAFFDQLVGPPMFQEYVGSVAEKMGKKYGVDWINLGFRLNATATMRQMCDDIHGAMLGVDWQNKPLSEFPIMNEVKSIKDDVDLIFVTTVGTPGYADWMTYVAEPLKKPLTGGASLTMYSGLQQYIRSGQLQGFLGGLRGAAEYEKLVGAPGKGCSGMDAQSLGHMMIITFLILGNIGYFASARKKSRA